MGYPYAVTWSAPLQPDVLSQWFGLAARQRAYCDWIRELRPESGSYARICRGVQCGKAPGIEPPAGIILRFYPSASSRPDYLSGCLRAASLGGDGDLRAACRLPRIGAVA